MMKIQTKAGNWRIYVVSVLCAAVSSPAVVVASNDSETSRERSLEQRQCFPGFVCSRGVCDLPTTSCICDPGWTGPFCDVSTTPQLTTILPGEPSTPTEKPDDVTAIAEPVLMVPDWEPLEEFGLLPPLSDRVCPGIGNFVCRYGNCSMQHGLECVCEPSFRDTFCDKPCTLDCGARGRCEFWESENGTQQERCYCIHRQYYGTNCSYVEPWVRSEDVLSPAAVAAVAVGSVLVAVLVALLLVFYLLWRRRNLTMMKLVYWFKPFEDDDEKAYDAFVSYASADVDRKFVVQTLVPHLESLMGFSLCLQERDCTAGQFLSQSISESVQQSRRTIMVVSPAYVDSGWCQFEFQMALQEMINHKHRILPLLLADVSSLKESMDSTLRKVIYAVKWIEYPSEEDSEKAFDNFWKRIDLSMPKKRRPLSEKETNSPNTKDPTVWSTYEKTSNLGKSSIFTAIKPSAPVELSSIGDNKHTSEPTPLGSSSDISLNLTPK